MATTLSDVLRFIRNPFLGSTDRQLIVEALNAQQRAKRAEAKAGLHRGMKVTWFDTYTRTTQTGIITKVNRVNVDVTDTLGRKWRCSPGLLQPAEVQAKDL